MSAARILNTRSETLLQHPSISTYLIPINVHVITPELRYHIHNTNFFQFQAIYSMAELIIKQEILRILVLLNVCKKFKLMNEVKEYHELCTQFNLTS